MNQSSQDGSRMNEDEVDSEIATANNRMFESEAENPLVNKNYQ